MDESDAHSDRLRWRVGRPHRTHLRFPTAADLRGTQLVEITELTTIALLDMGPLSLIAWRR
jgi:hypothetical protein